MLGRVAAFELRYQLANPILWITAAAVFLAAFAAGTGFLAEDQDVQRNSPFELISLYIMFSCLFMFVNTAFVADVVLRDDQTGFGPILRSTRIGKADYLFGRFLGAFAAAALCLALLPPAAWLGTLMPWVDPATLGPNRLDVHLYGYFLVALPNLLVSASLFFALATVSRSMMATYLGVLLFLMAYFTLDSVFGGWPELRLTMELGDPFGRIAIKDMTRYWTTAERNVLLPDFNGVLLWNRLIWTGVSLAILAAAVFFYRFAEKGMSTRRRRKLDTVEAPGAAPAAAASAAHLPSPRHGWPAARALLAARTRFEMALVFKSPAFILLMVWAMCTCFFALITQRDPDGRPSWPVTVGLIPELEDVFMLVPWIIVIIYAGELVWRDRDRKVHELIDATPYPNWAAIVPKMAAVSLVLAAVFMAGVAASASIQLGLGYTDLELGKYLVWFVLPRTVDMMIFAALAVFVQAVSPHKVIGWGVMILFVGMEFTGTAPDHNLLGYGGTPPVPQSDMNGPGAFLEGPWVFRLYWGAFAMLLLVAAHLVWPRGTETRLKPRLRLGARRLAGAPGRVALAALLTFGATGAYAWWNTDTLNRYRSPDDQLAELADYERRYLRFERLPQPAIVDARLDVALDPAERRAVTIGRYRLRNMTDQPISDVHVRLVDRELHFARTQLAGGRLATNDAEHGYRIYRLDAPMRPGEERVLTFETRRHHRGFRNGMPATGLVANGSMLHEKDLMPLIGMGRQGLIVDAAERIEQGLPAELPPPPDSESVGLAWATADIIVSTSADQVPIAPGRKVSDQVRGGRRIARFVSDRPIRLFFAVQSARYAEAHRNHRGIDLAVYHHPGHAWNVERMLDALGQSLDYYQANYGPYQFGQARIVEFPGYMNFAKGSPNTIPWSETLGFTGDFRDPATADYVSLNAAHEMAHQYWGNQLTAAGGPGAGLLTETLAQYSALAVYRRIYGEERIPELLRTQLDIYLWYRGNATAEQPLAHSQGQSHVIYQKGALAMSLIRARLGEAAVNRALRRLLDRYRFQPPTARASDLIAALRDEARTAGQQQLITDLFERITLYDLKVEAPRAVRRADGRWDVTVTVAARKLYADGSGNERPAALAEPIEIGLFTADPSSDVLDRRSVVTVQLRPIRSGRQQLRFVTERRPAFAAIDPYSLYIDRNLADNAMPVS